MKGCREADSGTQYGWCALGFKYSGHQYVGYFFCRAALSSANVCALSASAAIALGFSLFRAKRALPPATTFSLAILASSAFLLSMAS